MIRKIICKLIRHQRYPNPPLYWHSHERCARCGTLTLSPFIDPSRWSRWSN